MFLTFKQSSSVSIREVSRVIELLVSSCPGLVYYRAFEHDKVQALI